MINFEIKLKAFFFLVLLAMVGTVNSQNVQFMSGGEYDFYVVTLHSQQDVIEVAAVSAHNALHTQLQLAIKHTVKTKQNTGFNFYVEGVDQQDFGVTYSGDTRTYEFNDLRFQDLTNLRKYMLAFMMRMYYNQKVPISLWKPRSVTILYARHID